MTISFFIDPALCIACEQCVLVCPVDAIYLEHEVPEEWKASIERNRDFFLEAKEDTPAVSLEWAEQLIRLALVRAGELGIDVRRCRGGPARRARRNVPSERRRADQGPNRRPCDFRRARQGPNRRPGDFRRTRKDADRCQPGVQRRRFRPFPRRSSPSAPSNAPPSRSTARGSSPGPAASR